MSKRGYVSLNGVVTTVAQDNGKGVDFDVLSKTCKTCETWEKKKIHQSMTIGKS